MARTVNLYVVESRFQALIALLVARSQPDHEHVLGYFIESIGEFTGRFPFVRSVFLGHRLQHGWWKKPRTLRRQVDTLVAAATAGGPVAAVHYHCANLKTPLLNYPIHALRQALPHTSLHVHILTDGTSNFKRRHLSDKAAARLHRLARRPLPWLLGLRFTPFDRERFGIDASLVERIYLLPGAPHQYDPAKVVAVPIVDLGLPAADPGPGGKRALVIGEKLTERGWLAEADEQQIAARVAGLIADSGITEVDYVPHPTATRFDLWQPHYIRVSTTDPIELRIMQHRYALICGIASTALFTARLLQPAGGRTVSVGLEAVTGRNALAATIGQAFAGMGVEQL